MPSGLRFSYSQIILAGGDGDVSAADLIDWVLPVLSSLPREMWFGCEILAASRGCLTARIRSGGRPSHLALCCTVPRGTAQKLRRILPAPPPFALILLNAHAPQVMALLDGMARWLSQFEVDDPLPAPLIALMKALGGQRGHPGVRTALTTWAPGT
ncbi:hypothetical protein [Aestuariivirga sp.]|uniref:hypothetical protein n=1 Tax=Aestuariivirga sp. TaxID=2650926 RepID=UPI003BAC172D